MNTTGFIDLHSDTIMVCNREKLDFINPKTHISLDKLAPSGLRPMPSLFPMRSGGRMQLITTGSASGIFAASWRSTAANCPRCGMQPMWTTLLRRANLPVFWR